MKSFSDWKKDSDEDEVEEPINDKKECDDCSECGDDCDCDDEECECKKKSKPAIVEGRSGLLYAVKQ